MSCTNCDHLKQGTLKCKAFPTGIPMFFVSGQRIHTRVIDGQTGDFVYSLKGKPLQREIENADRFRNAKFLDFAEWEIIGTCAGLDLYKVGTNGPDILVAKDMGKRVKAIELSALMTHSAQDITLKNADSD
jgi:hypothetical protein